MPTDDDSNLSVSGTAYLGRTDERVAPFGKITLGLAVATAVLAGVTTATAVETGNGNVGLGLLAAVALTAGTAVALEFGRRLDT